MTRKLHEKAFHKWIIMQYGLFFRAIKRVMQACHVSCTVACINKSFPKINF